MRPKPAGFEPREHRKEKCTQSGEENHARDSHFFGQGIEHLENLRLVLTRPHLSIVPVDNLSSSQSATTVAGEQQRQLKQRGRTYHWPLEVVSALLEFPQSLLLIGGALDNGPNALLVDVVEDGLQLVGGGGILGDLELELGPAHGVGLSGVVAGLVLGGSLRGGGRGLPQGGSHPHRRRRGGLVEEGDDVERFVLHVIVSGTIWIE